jgi:hypothetical protein
VTVKDSTGLPSMGQAITSAVGKGVRETERAKPVRRMWWQQGPGPQGIIASVRPLKAHVRGGRLLLDEPTDVPEGEVVELVPLDEVLASGGDCLDPEERQRLEESLERSVEDARAGRLVVGEQVIARLHGRM